MEPGNLGFSASICIDSENAQLAKCIFELCGSIEKDAINSAQTSLWFEGTPPLVLKVVCSDGPSTHLNDGSYNLQIHISPESPRPGFSKTKLCMFDCSSHRSAYITFEDIDQTSGFIDSFLRFCVLPKLISSSADEFFNMFSGSQASARVFKFNCEASAFDNVLYQAENQHDKIFVIISFAVDSVVDVETEEFFGRVLRITDNISEHFINRLRPDTVVHISETYTTSHSAPVMLAIVGA